MAPLPESNTKRYWGIYTVATDVHKFLMRTGDTMDDTTAIAQIEFAWNLVKTTMGTNVTLIGVEVAENGSNVRNPLAISAPIVGTGGGDIPDIQRPREWTIKGRSTDGRRSGISLFGVFENTPDDWKQEPIALAELVALRAFLQVQTDSFVTISGTHPTWHDKTTVTYNDHWVEERRSS